MSRFALMTVIALIAFSSEAEDNVLKRYHSMPNDYVNATLTFYKTNRFRLHCAFYESAPTTVNGTFEEGEFVYDLRLDTACTGTECVPITHQNIPQLIAYAGHAPLINDDPHHVRITKDPKNLDLCGAYIEMLD